MRKNNSQDPSFWKKILSSLNSFLKFLRNKNQQLTSDYPTFLEFFQLLVLYFLAFISLVISSIDILGEISGFFLNSVPEFLLEIINFPIIKFLLAPEKSYVIYLIVLQFIIFRPVFNFSKLFKYNLLLIFLLEMFQNLIVSYWDLFFNTPLIDSSMETDISFGIVFISVIFCIFFLMYFYSFFCSIRGKFVTFPYMFWLTDSICFWLYIKTPTMDKRS